jgi:hypothetical protein
MRKDSGIAIVAFCVVADEGEAATAAPGDSGVAVARITESARQRRAFIGAPPEKNVSNDDLRVGPQSAAPDPAKL